MARVWIELFLLLIVVLQVGGRGDHGGGGGPFPEGAGWVLFAIFAVPIGFCCLIIALCSTACDDGTEDQRGEIEKNGLILPTGQWYAPSAVINDAWYRMVLHGIAWYCMVLHGIARY